MQNKNEQRNFISLHKYARQLLIAFLCAALSLLTLSTPSVHADSSDYTITYDSGAGTGTMAPQTGTTAFAVYLDVNTFTPPSGQHFVGWLDGNNVSYADGESILLPSGFTGTLTAQYASGDDCYIVQSGTLLDGSSCSGDLTIDSSITSIGDGAFFQDEGLTSVVIPNNVTSIGNNAFGEDANITLVTIGNGVTTIGNDAFTDNDSLASVTIGSSVISIGSGAFNDDTSLTSVTIPNGVTSIGNYAFSFDNLLTSIAIPNSVVSIGVAVLDGDTSLTSVTIGSGVTSIGNQMFFNDVALTSIIIPSNVITIGDDAFSGDSLLTSIVIPNSVTQIGDSAFQSDSSLASIVIPDSVTQIDDGAFADDTSLVSIVIPNAVTEIGNALFVRDSSLISVTIGSGVTSIGQNAFAADTSLASIVIPDNVTSINDLAFDGDTSLSLITIGNGVTTIGAQVFQSDTSLSSITIPDSVTSIGDWAFNGDSSLASVTIPNGLISMAPSALAGDTALASIAYCGVNSSVVDISYPNNIEPICPDGHIVTFDNNSGSGAMHHESTDVATPLKTNTFTRTGYTFTGWNEAADDSGNSYADGANYDFTANLTLYAQWNSNLANFTVTFDSNGGSGTMAPEISSTWQALTPNAFTNSPLVFAGWNTDPNGNGASYYDQSQFPFTSDTTLYAQWHVPHTVTFNANGGTGTMASEQGAFLTPLTPNSFTNSGKVFLHWNTSADGSGQSWGDGEQAYFDGGDFTLYAQWAVSIPTLSFDANGGTGSMSSIPMTYPLSIPSNLFTNTGKTFNYWSTNSDGTGSLIYNGGGEDFFDTDTTLYAQWYVNPPVVSFDANGGTGTMAPQSLPQPNALNPNTFTRSGYTFTGWNTAVDGSGVSNCDTCWTYINNDETLYAQWTSNNHTVNFDANGGTGSMDPETGSSDQPLTLNTFTNSSLYFGGWDTHPTDGFGDFYADGDIYNFSSDITLYAQWSACSIGYCLVTFDGNGSDSYAFARQGDNGVQALIPNSTLLFVRSGYTFNGWNTAADGTGVPYADGDNYDFSSDGTLYAQWSPNSVAHTVTFDANGGTGTMTPETASTSQNLTSNTFSFPGHTFTGQWNTAPDGSGTYYSDSAPYPFNADITLYAQWTYTVSFNANGGTGTITPEIGGWPYYLTANSFTRVGYTFAGWNKHADGSSTAYSDNEFAYIFSDTTLYAQWTTNPTHTITYSLAGGSGTRPTQSAVSQGASFNVALGTGLTRAGFTFNGWNDGITFFAAGAPYIVGTSNITLTARWSPNPTQIITYALNGGSGTLPIQSPISQGASFNVASGTGLIKAGFIFTGWSDGTTIYAAGTAYAVGTSDITLTAQWSSFTVIFNANGGAGTMSNEVGTTPAALTLNSFTLTNDIFVDWNTSQFGTGISYADGAIYPFTADTTLYAQWTLSPAALAAAQAAAQAAAAAQAVADKAAADAAALAAKTAADAAAAQAAADKAIADKAAADAAAAAKALADKAAADKAAADKAAADAAATARATAAQAAADQATIAKAAAVKAAADKAVADKAAAQAAADAAQALAAAKKNPADPKLQAAAKDAGASSTVAKAAAAKEALSSAKAADATAIAVAKVAIASAATDAAAIAKAAAAKAAADASPNDAQLAADASAAEAAKVAADQAAADAAATAKAAAGQAATAKAIAAKAAAAAGSNAVSISKSSGGVTPVKLNLPSSLAGKTVSVELAILVNGKWTYKIIGTITLNATGDATFKSKVPLPKGAVINIKGGNTVLQGYSVG